MKTTKQIVLEILKKYPKTRSSDKELFLVYEERYSLNATPKWFLNNQINFLFIRDAIRYRAQIQRSWLYPPRKKVKEFRDKRREAKTREFSDYNWRKVKSLPIVEVQGKKVKYGKI